VRVTEHLPTHVPCVHRAAGYCSELARSTFRMEEDFGAARVFQQAGDEAEVCSRALLTLALPAQILHPVDTTAHRT